MAQKVGMVVRVGMAVVDMVAVGMVAVAEGVTGVEAVVAAMEAEVVAATALAGEEAVLLAEDDDRYVPANLVACCPRAQDHMRLDSLF